LLTKTDRPLRGAEGSRSESADFELESRGKIEAKGKGEMVMWFVSIS
jgi:hypothetical protein